jgi:haloalkane dehalogenase
MSAEPVVRTPDERFEGLPGYPFEPHYVTVEAEGVMPLRMHHVDAGNPRGRPVLLVHGQPTWSYLYRKVIAALADRGFRVIAPDNIGFGRSDKPTQPTEYTLARHVEWLASLVRQMRLADATLVVQDWGGPIGLGALTKVPDAFGRVVAANTILHTCDPWLEGRLTWAHHALDGGRMVLEEALLDYARFFQRAPDILPSVFLNAVAGPLPEDVLAAYDAPFPDPAYKAGLRQLTALIPLTRNDPGAAINRATLQFLERWERPFLTAYSDGDPATRGWETIFQEKVPGADGQPHVTIRDAGHFLQEQQGERLAEAISWFAAGS